MFLLIAVRSYYTLHSTYLQCLRTSYLGLSRVPPLAVFGPGKRKSLLGIGQEHWKQAKRFAAG